MSSSISFLHIQSALASSQQLWMGPKLLTAASSLRPHRHPSPSLSLVVEAKARTRREDRTARHYRIRKKVFLSIYFFLSGNLSTIYMFHVMYLSIYSINLFALSLNCIEYYRIRGYNFLE